MAGWYIFFPLISAEDYYYMSLLLMQAYLEQLQRELELELELDRYRRQQSQSILFEETVPVEQFNTGTVDYSRLTSFLRVENSFLSPWHWNPPIDVYNDYNSNIYELTDLDEWLVYGSDSDWGSDSGWGSDSYWGSDSDDDSFGIQETVITINDEEIDTYTN